MFVEDGYRGVKQSCGAYDGKVEPGCAIYCCPLQNITPVSVRVKSTKIMTETKTQDNVIVNVETTVLYKINAQFIDKAFFKLTDERGQIGSYVDDVVRSELPGRTLDEAYIEKNVMSDAVKKNLEDHVAETFGLVIMEVLITDLQPDSKVIDAMNMINTQKRLRAAAQEKAEADKIAMVKNAEADMEAKHLSGVGVAKMRMAITNGCKESIECMTETVGLAPNDVVHMMLVTQYLDTLKDFSTMGRNAVMVPSSNGGGENAVRQGILTAGMVQGGAMAAPPPPPGGRY